MNYHKGNWRNIELPFQFLVFPVYSLQLRELCFYYTRSLVADLAVRSNDGQSAGELSRRSIVKIEGVNFTMYIGLIIYDHEFGLVP